METLLQWEMKDERWNTTQHEQLLHFFDRLGTFLPLFQQLIAGVLEVFYRSHFVVINPHGSERICHFVLYKNVADKALCLVENLIIMSSTQRPIIRRGNPLWYSTFFYTQVRTRLFQISKYMSWHIIEWWHNSNT